MALEVVGQSGAASALQRQPRLGAFECLDLRFFVEPMRQRIGGRAGRGRGGRYRPACNEGGIIRELEALPAMRRQAICLPDLWNGGGADADRLGHRPRRPVGRLIGRRRHRRHCGGLLIENRCCPWRPGLVPQKPVDALMHEPDLLASQGRLRCACRVHDRGCSELDGAEQIGPGAPSMFLRDVAAGGDACQRARVSFVRGDRYPSAHTIGFAYTLALESACSGLFASRANHKQVLVSGACCKSGR